MSIYNLGKNRMLCWDDFLIDESANTEIRQHKPIKKNVVLEGTKIWEGNALEYASLIKVNGKYRFYYRARGGHFEILPDGSWSDGHGPQFCLAESTDGKTFTRTPLNKIEFRGIKHNNIYFNEDRDNFSVCYDENPDCPENERFKAFTLGGGECYPQDDGPHGLFMFVSGDGINFESRGRLPLEGSFDSYNIMFWDNDTKTYHFYYRSEYRTDGEETVFGVIEKPREIFRTINHSTTKDFIHFEHHGEIDYGDGHFPVQFYTNQIEKYYRANDMYLGIATRYLDRVDDNQNFKFMPLAETHELREKLFGRLGTVLTDNILLTSRDTYRFNKWEDAFMTPEIEADNNWFYGDCYTCYGIYETESDIEGAPNELSFICNEEAISKVRKFYRYTLRLDGFISWYAKFCGGNGGEILTKPFTFCGSELEINFASSAFGDVIVTVCDEEGNELDGYKSYRIFGDSVNRKVEFEKNLKDLENKPIRLKFFLRDCDLYSFKFN